MELGVTLQDARTEVEKIIGRGLASYQLKFRSR